LTKTALLVHYTKS